MDAKRRRQNERLLVLEIAVNAKILREFTARSAGFVYVSDRE